MNYSSPELGQFVANNFIDTRGIQILCDKQFYLQIANLDFRNCDDWQ